MCVETKLQYLDRLTKLLDAENGNYGMTVFGEFIRERIVCVMKSVDIELNIHSPKKDQEIQE